jgi:propionyl-CoA carboxylase alpha chain
MTKIKKILVANRGEIALRIIRTAKEMDIKTVAVYSEADRDSLHVFHADEAVCIGPPPSNQSYLKIDKIIEVAQQRNADAIHPGYGFLSENAAFSEACDKAGIIFIGPSAESIRVMGSKLAAKEAVADYDIPLIPGSKGAISDPEEAKKVAQEIGFPVLIKASAGGGGKGMRVVESLKDLDEQMQRAISEATSAFGDGSVFIEKYVTKPRHIEFQIIGDKHGNVVHLFERECSVQRRHQKVVEEAPSAVLTPELRERMGEAAKNVARSCNYYNAGTVEFIMDENLNFYFLEMNTRLQVEHPVTEMITRLDLVKEQIHIAEGEKLSFTQDEVSMNGHSIEVRVYAEDPENNFLPDTGTLETYIRPQGNGVRLDDGFREGQAIPIYYDPMIAKLVSYGHDREEAIRKMIRAIDEYKITGLTTTLPFGKFVMEHEAFVSGHFDTNFVAKYFKPEEQKKYSETEKSHKIAAALTNMLMEAAGGAEKQPEQNGHPGSGKTWKNRLKKI